MRVAVYEYTPPADLEEERRVADKDRRQSLTLQQMYKEKPELERRKEQRRKNIEIPDKKGTATTVITYRNGMTFYMERTARDWAATERFTDWLSEQLGDSDVWAVALPPSAYPELGYVVIPVGTIKELLNIHDQFVESPLAIPTGTNRQIRRHGPGKRQRR